MLKAICTSLADCPQITPQRMSDWTLKHVVQHTIHVRYWLIRSHHSIIDTSFIWGTNIHCKSQSNDIYYTRDTDYMKYCRKAVGDITSLNKCHRLGLSFGHDCQELMGRTCDEEGQSLSGPSEYRTHARKRGISTGQPNRYDTVSSSSYKYLLGPRQKRMRCSLMHAPCALAH